MRFPLAIAACLGLALITSVPASAQSQGGSGGHLLVFKNGRLADESEAAGGVRVLRGSAAPARAAAAPRYDTVLGPGRWQTVAGERLWLFDRGTGRLASCRNRPTVNVGERELECTFGTFSRYRRTFGDNFMH